MPNRDSYWRTRLSVPQDSVAAHRLSVVPEGQRATYVKALIAKEVRDRGGCGSTIYDRALTYTQPMKNFNELSLPVAEYIRPIDIRFSSMGIDHKLLSWVSAIIEEETADDTGKPWKNRQNYLRYLIENDYFKTAAPDGLTWQQYKLCYNMYAEQSGVKGETKHKNYHFTIESFRALRNLARVPQGKTQTYIKQVIRRDIGEGVIVGEGIQFGTAGETEPASGTVRLSLSAKTDMDIIKWLDEQGWLRDESWLERHRHYFCSNDWAIRDTEFAKWKNRSRYLDELLEFNGKPDCELTDKERIAIRKRPHGLIYPDGTVREQSDNPYLLNGADRREQALNSLRVRLGMERGRESDGFEYYYDDQYGEWLRSVDGVRYRRDGSVFTPPNLLDELDD